MSINVLQTIMPDSSTLLNMGAMFWFAGSITAVVILLFRSPSLDRSRRRIGEGDSRSLLLMIVSSAVFAYLATQITYVRALGVSKPEAISDRDMVMMATLADAIAAATMLIMTVALRRDGVRRLGIDVRHALAALVQAPAFLVLLYPLMMVVGAVSASIWDHFHSGIPPEHEMIRMLQENPGAALQWLITVSAVVAAPIAEELFFRGYLQTLIRETPVPPWLAILLSSVAFTLVHSPPEIWPVIFVLAMGLGYIYERTGNLATTMLMHAVFNGTQIVLVLHGMG